MADKRKKPDADFERNGKPESDDELFDFNLDDDSETNEELKYWEDYFEDDDWEGRRRPRKFRERGRFKNREF